MGIGPVPATEAALGRAGLKLAVMREWKFTEEDHERTNVHGSGISLGHPVGARRRVRYGLETMCIGGGQGLAAVFERVV